jgi:Zn-dependent protease
LANISDILARMLYVLPALLVGVVVHEYAHGRVAEMMGDPTARNAGRLTFNPLPHLDPFTSVLLPLLLLITGSPILFAAAKPVPVNPMFFKHGRRDFFWVGVAGPASNLCIAFLSGIVLAVVFAVAPGAYTALRVLESMVTINCVLAVFNLIPLPPLDGSRLVEAYMPQQWLKGYTSIEPFGIFIIFGLFFFVPGFFNSVIWPVVSGLAAFFMSWPLILKSLIGL